jgi:hypothetical protein
LSDKTSNASFLGTFFSDWNQKHQQKKELWFSFYREVDDYSHTLLRQISFDPKDVQKLLAVTLYCRGVTLFEAFYLLAEKGMMAEARVIARTLLELIFVFSAVIKDRSFAIEVIHDEFFQQKKLLGNTLSSQEKEKTLSEKSIQDLKGKKLKLEQEIENRVIKKKRTIKEIAELAGLGDRYQKEYLILSRSVHTAVRDLEQYLLFNEDKTLRQINFGPTDKDFDFFVFSIVENMLQLILTLRSVFALTNDAHLLNAYIVRLKNLARSINGLPMD